MNNLQTFRPGEIYLSPEDAYAVLKFYWPDLAVQRDRIRPDDVAFAQGLLVEGIDASYKMGYAHLLFDNFCMKPPGSFTQISKMVGSFLRKAGKHWFKSMQSGKSLDDAKIYDAVRVTIAQRFRSDAADRFNPDQ